MRTIDQQLRYEELELISRCPQVPPTLLKQVTSALQTIWHHTMDYFTRGDEPRIRMTSTQSGQKIWHLYDPVTQEKVTASSEEEVRFWLETRYYR